MASRHSTYKKRNRWENATPFDKANSKYQRKINFLSNIIKKKDTRLKAYKYICKKHGEVFKKLVDENMASKDYLKPYLPRKKDVLKLMREKR